ncbi:MAG: aldose epimerase family protein [Candidatus Dormibacteria bacterium]
MTLTLRAGDDSVTVDQVSGGRLSSLHAGGAERLVRREDARTLAPDLYWGAFPMVPWPGRLKDGDYVVDGDHTRIEPNLGPSAIHGLCFDRPWTVLQSSATEVLLRCAFAGRGWRYGGWAEQRFVIEPGRLDLEVTIDGLRETAVVGAGIRGSAERGPGICASGSVPATSLTRTQT